MSVAIRKRRVAFVCSDCGHAAARWMGRCPACESWDSMVEEALNKKSAPALSGAPVAMPDVTSERAERMVTGWSEFDRVLGGGIVPGSVVMLAGEPGMGKSTLMLMMADRVGQGDVLYVAGEESPQQIKMRADRLGISTGRIKLFAETDVTRLESAVVALEPDVLIVDSIQSLHSPDVPSGPGSVIQTRSCTIALQRLAKRLEVPTFIVGHVTKDGDIAGPKVLEHTVDTVVQFEGDRHHAFRILRAIKNRFGSCNEIGVFEMGADGLREVTNPSERFLSCRRTDVSGSAVICTVEGTRPVLLEMQALVSERAYGTPQRTATGFDMRRLQMLLAVLGRRARIRIADRDIFVNAVAGARIEEPAADAGVVAALASAAQDRPVPSDVVLIGEVGLAGELRGVSRLEHRLVEASRLGFRRAIVPEDASTLTIDGLELMPVRGIPEMLSRLDNLA